MNNSIILYSVNVDGANPNGDPRNDNRPRMTDEGNGIITQYCIKHKVRNRLHDMGFNVFHLNDNGTITDKVKELINNSDVDKNNGDAIAKFLKETFIDIRVFGAMTSTIKIPSSGKKDVRVGAAVSKPAVTFSDPKTMKEISPYSYGITSCVALMEKTDEKGSNTMGSGCDRVFNATYFGDVGINALTCERNGVTEDDIEKFIFALKTVFDNDQAAARPVGSMRVNRMIKIDCDENVDTYELTHSYHKYFDDNGNLKENALNTDFGNKVTIIK